jgi:hypothetical protein
MTSRERRNFILLISSNRSIKKSNSPKSITDTRTTENKLEKLWQFYNPNPLLHIAGWTHQSKEKLAQVIVDKILAGFQS